MGERIRHILHADMDAFFASVEQRDRPELQGKPVIVGGRVENRGVVSAASYEVRKYGVRSAMSSQRALALCPHAVFIEPRHKAYAAASAEVMEILRSFTPVIEKVSVDEAFLDVKGVLSLWDNEPVALAKELKRRVFSELQLTVSVGVAPNKFLAKLASDQEKPDGLTVVPSDSEEIKAYLADMPVTVLWGVGAATEKQLAKFSIRKIADLQNLDKEALQRYVGKKGGEYLYELARGHDERPVVTEHESKSISSEETFPEDKQDAEFLRQTVLEHMEISGRQLREEQKLAGTVVIKLRFADFNTITRQCSLPAPTDSDRILVNAALDLFEKEKIKKPVRLVGAGVTNLMDERPVRQRQQSLFPEFSDLHETKQEKVLDNTVDELRNRFGRDIIKRGNWKKSNPT